MLTLKQKLILFLISCEPGIKGIRKLVTIFDRHDFPSEMGINLGKLLEHKLIFVSDFFDNGTPARYQITNTGRRWLRDNFNADELLSYFDVKDRPNLLHDITEAYIKKILNNDLSHLW